MNKLLLFLLTAIFLSCNSSQKSQNIDSIKIKATRDSTKPNGNKNNDNTSDGDDTPTQAEERERFSKTYNDVKIIDTVVINDNDTLRFYLKHYCLKDSDLVIPKIYDINKKIEFVTHPFVYDMLLIHNRDTVLRKQFKAIDFNPFFSDNYGGGLKKYGTMDVPNLSKRNKDNSRIIVHCPIHIPSTDTGIGLFLIISKNGNYKIVDDY